MALSKQTLSGLRSSLPGYSGVDMWVQAKGHQSNASRGSCGPRSGEVHASSLWGLASQPLGICALCHEIPAPRTSSGDQRAFINVSVQANGGREWWRR